MDGLNDNSTIGIEPPGLWQTCQEYENSLTEGLQPHQILSFGFPLNDSHVWTERDNVWTSCFIVYSVTMGMIFLVLGVSSLFFLIKKDCIRLPTKTFFAVYMSIAVLGFSRVLWLGCDMFGYLGFIGGQFPDWVVLSRVLKAFGFPSLVASYTVIIFTLIKITKAMPGKHWYHFWKYVIPIKLFPYVVSLLAELISEVTLDHGMLAIIICDLVFIIWSLFTCIAFLLSGIRLLREIRKREQRTVRVSSAGVNTLTENFQQELATQQAFASREHQRHTQRTRNTTRKILIITFATALSAILYSILSTGAVIIICLHVYYFCLGYIQRGNTAVWLAIETCRRVSEIILAIVILYSITDITWAVKWCRKCFKMEKQTVQSNIHNSDLNCQSTTCESMQATQTQLLDDMNDVVSTATVLAEVQEETPTLIADPSTLVFSTKERTRNANSLSHNQLSHNFISITKSSSMSEVSASSSLSPRQERVQFGKQSTNTSVGSVEDQELSVEDQELSMEVLTTSTCTVRVQ